MRLCAPLFARRAHQPEAEPGSALVLTARQSRRYAAELSVAQIQSTHDEDVAVLVDVEVESERSPQSRIARAVAQPAAMDSSVIDPIFVGT